MKAITIDLNHSSVTNDRRGPRTSSRFNALPTLAVVDRLTDRGWRFASGSVQATRDLERRPFAKHVLTFEHSELKMPGELGSRGQLVLINGAMGNSSFRVMLGAFRIACANGLVFGDVVTSQRHNHLHLNVDQVLASVDRTVEQAPTVFASIARWTERRLGGHEQRELAERMAAVRWGGRLDEVNFEALLWPRRREDQADDAWTTFNRVQEGVVRGGFTVGNRAAMPIVGAASVLKVNSKLWDAARAYLN